MKYTHLLTILFLTLALICTELLHMLDVQRISELQAANQSFSDAALGASHYIKITIGRQTFYYTRI